MATKMSQAELGVLDPDTYANGNPKTYGLPLDAYRYLRDEEPVCLHKFEDDPTLLDRLWLVSRHEDITYIDKTPELFAADRGVVNYWAFAPIGENAGAPAMLTMDGDPHRQARGTVNKQFRPNVVKKLEDRFREFAVSVIESALKKNEPFNFVDEIAHNMPMQALGDVLGVPEGDRPKFFGWVDKFAAPFDTRITPSFEEVGQAIVDLYEYAIELEQLRRDEPGDNVMSLLAAAGMPEDQVRGNVALLASGAAESTRTSLSHGMHELMRRPDQMEWLRERADDIPPTVAPEIVRISSPFTHLCRTVTQDTEIRGQELKEGEIVGMMFAAGNFDPDGFDDPDEFDLSRENNPLLSFGRGPHQCLGKHVAQLEIKILFEELLQRTKEIRPAGDIKYIRDAYSRGVYELPVEMVPA